MKTIFNKVRVAWVIGVAALALSGAGLDMDAHAQGRPQPSGQPSIVMFRDGADQVQAERSPGGSAEISLRIRGRAGHASIDKRAIVQLSATEDRRADAFLRAQRVSAVVFKTSPQPLAANTDALLSGEHSPREAVPLNPRLRLYLIESADPAEDGLALAARLSNVDGVESAIPDLHYERRLADFESPPNDPRYPGQWYLEKLQLERTWQVAVGNPDTSIVVIDDGCDTQHPDLAAAMLGGLDVLDDDEDPSYTPNLGGNEHGTACSGIIAAVGNNKLGITGVCPTCSLRCVRLFDRGHALVPVSADVRAFNFAYETGAAVVSNSWGFSEPQPVPYMVRAAIQELLESGRGGKGALVVFAAGNENREIDAEEIAAIPGVLNVGALNYYDEAAPFSNYGKSLSVTAPTGTLTTDISGPDGADKSDYTSLFGGTSSACPVVAGVAALLVTAVPDRTGMEISAALINSARSAPFATPDAMGHDPLYGHGIVDPSAALIALGVDVPKAPVAERDAGEDDRDSGKPDREPSKQDDGCGCSVPGGERPAPTPLLAAGLAIALVWRARRRSAKLNPRCRP
jgi:MYXO-CTERM domain-containing protein